MLTHQSPNLQSSEFRYKNRHFMKNPPTVRTLQKAPSFPHRSNLRAHLSESSE